MAKLVYSVIASLDGYVADADGRFDWAAPSDEVHQFVNDLERGIGTYLYGRRMYEVMRIWATPDALPDQSDVMLDFARLWAEAEKVVYSTTLDAPTTEHTRLERAFDPQAVAALKGDATSDISVGGPTLAAAALVAGLVDECHLLLVPVTVGAGLAAFPRGVRLELELLGERRFADGVVHLHHRLL